MYIECTRKIVSAAESPPFRINQRGAKYYRDVAITPLEIHEPLLFTDEGPQTGSGLSDGSEVFNIIRRVPRSRKMVISSTGTACLRADSGGQVDGNVLCDGGTVRRCRKTPISEARAIAQDYTQRMDR
jgi:hypothetical protein